MSTLRKYFRKFKPDKTSNLKVVVLCVVTATTFWLLNALNKDNYTTVVNQPISLQFDPTEYMAVKDLPKEVKIQINGNGWDLLKKHLKITQLYCSFAKHIRFNRIVAATPAIVTP